MRQQKKQAGSRFKMSGYSKDFCICNACELERSTKRMGYFGGESLRAGCHIKPKDELNPHMLKYPRRPAGRSK